jgi:hypothetical protein
MKDREADQDATAIRNRVNSDGPGAFAPDYALVTPNQSCGCEPAVACYQPNDRFVPSLAGHTLNHID